MVSRILSMNEKAKAPILMRQVSTELSLQVIRFFRSRTQTIFVEVTPHHLVLSDKDAEELGSLGKISPPLRSKSNVSALWSAILNGEVSLVSSDHSPHLLSEKRTDSIWDASAGFPGVETLVPLMLDQVAKGRLSVHQLTSLMSTNPAKIFGLYPRKGVIKAGASADLTVVDLKKYF